MLFLLEWVTCPSHSVFFGLCESYHMLACAKLHLALCFMLWSGWGVLCMCSPGSYFTSLMRPPEAESGLIIPMCLISRLNEFELFSVLQSRFIVNRTKRLPWSVVVVSGRNSSLSLGVILLLVIASLPVM